jgi:hypothetical protein
MLNRVRFRWSGNFYGDQALFVRRDVFDRIGGFPDLPLLEDLRFSQRLRSTGRTAILQPAVLTSPRRFLAHGVIRQAIQDFVLLSCDALGLSPASWWTRYNLLNHRAHGLMAEDGSLSAIRTSPLAGQEKVPHAEEYGCRAGRTMAAGGQMAFR